MPTPAEQEALRRIGNRIRDGRGQRLVIDVARAVEVNPNTWSRWEAGAWMPTFGKQLLIAETLGIDWVDLFDPRPKAGEL